MSVNQSDLSNQHYGYDFVVALTQESINATMKEYLYNAEFPVVRMYWNQDAAGNPVVVSYDELMTQTNNTDPLKVPSWNTGEPLTPEITNINNSNFYFAFEASIGVPPDVAPSDIPDIITLQENSQTVIFNLLCEEFTVAACSFGRHGLTGFLNASQPTDSPWIFSSKVALQNILDNKNLPPNVQAQLNDFGPDAFSVQQLIFDFDNAALDTPAKIGGITPGSPVYTILSEVFFGAYFTAMKTNAQPVLGYSIVKNTPTANSSTLELTDMAMEVSPYLDPNTKTDDDSGLNTLNYLCATGGKTLPPPVPFAWNWLEKSDESDCDGVISINRNTFTDYFREQLTPYVSKNCYLPYVHVYGDIHYDYSLTAGQAPDSITQSPTGTEVLKYTYDHTAFDQAGLDGDMGRLTLRSAFNLSLNFTGNTFVIVQTLLIYVKLRRYASTLSWNPIDITYTDTYTLGVDQTGKLTINFDPAETNNSQAMPHANWFIEIFTKLDDFSAKIQQMIDNFVTPNYTNTPVNFPQYFVFPGGKTFAFKNVVFSENQDLAAQITYTQTE